MFCMPEGSSTPRWAHLACGLESYLLGDSGVSFLVDESEAAAPQNRWRVSSAPKALQRPFVFQSQTLNEFKKIVPRATDVLVASYPRCGLTWVHAIVFYLSRSDDHGRLLVDPSHNFGGKGPLYPESRNSSVFKIEHLVGQEDPRIMTTHVRPAEWPDIDRVVVVTRDPRDALVSTYFRIKGVVKEMQAMIQEMRQLELQSQEDERLLQFTSRCSNQTLDEVYEDFNDDGSAAPILSGLMDDGIEEERPAEPNTRVYADWYTWHAELLALSRNRAVKVVTYEDLHHDPRGVVADIAMFLGFPPTASKIDRCVEFASFGAVSARCEPHYVQAALRKGVMGDHKIYLTREHWDAMVRRTIRRFHRDLPMRSLVIRVAADSPATVPTPLRPYVLPPPLVHAAPSFRASQPGRLSPRVASSPSGTVHNDDQRTPERGQAAKGPSANHAGSPATPATLGDDVDEKASIPDELPERPSASTPTSQAETTPKFRGSSRRVAFGSLVKATRSFSGKPSKASPSHQQASTG